MITTQTAARVPPTCVPPADFPRDSRPPARSAPPTLSDLTSREREIAALVAAAKRNKEIAAALCISRQTVDGHLRNIYAKLQISNRVELALLVLQEAPHSPTTLRRAS